MKILSENKSSELLIESCCPEIASYPSICLVLLLKTEYVSGRLNEVWIAGDEMDRFLRQLTILDVTRKEAATLKSMSPIEFAMSLFPLDLLGHIGLKVAMHGRKYRRGEKFFEFAVEGAFEIDPTSVPQIIADFNELISQPKASTF